MYEIPLDPLPAQRFSIMLGDQQCMLHIYWRGGRIYCDLDTGGIRIVTGAICQNRTTILQSPTSGFKGVLFFADTRGEEAPQWQGLGDRWLLLYQPETATGAAA